MDKILIYIFVGIIYFFILFFVGILIKELIRSYKKDKRKTEGSQNKENT